MVIHRNDLSDNPDDPLRWDEAIGEYVARGEKAKALRFLDKVIDEGDLPLFRDWEEMEEQKQLAFLYKMSLLEEWGRSKEALAWACLECDLHPDNIDALAMRENLKQQLGLSRRQLNSRRSMTPSTSRDYRWEDVAGMRKLKAILERDVILPIMQPEVYKRYKVTLPNGILLYGPPGCGKTFIARRLAKILAFNFIEVKPSDLASIYVHGGQEKIGELFSKARKKRPCMIFFDEIDALLPKRSDLSHHYAAEVNEFLVNLNECWEKGVFVLGATNAFDKIDPAVLRPGRFDKKVHVDLPDFETRMALFKVYMANRPQEEMNWQYLARISDGYTCAEIEFLVNEAARWALAAERDIAHVDIEKCMKATPPAFGPKQ